jgi:Lipase maturation factor
MRLLLGLDQPAPELIWGLVSRGIGVVFLIAFLSLRPQVLVMAGRDGILPIGEALRAQARDFPTWKRFFYFPTLLWLDSSDFALRAVVWLGIAASAATIIGGPYTSWALLACYVAFLSLDRAMTLVYPWDSMLLEAGFWGAFLPATQMLPNLECITPPAAPAAWAFRLLAFRVLFGFGKHKFLGSTPQDIGFLRGFLATQPLPTRVGWFAQKAPLPVLKFGLIALFFVEIVLPFAVFAPGPLATIAAEAAIGLMAGIFVMGNFGHFNLILVVVVISWFDHATARELNAAALQTPVGVVFAVHAVLSLFALPFNTFSSFTWPMWSSYRRGSVLWTWPLAVARAVMPFRVVHPYGVFPPYSPPSARITPVTEVTWDGEEWLELEHRFWPTREHSVPRWCAPHHERFDQAVVYEGVGLNERSIFRGAIGRWDPYGHAGMSAPQRFMQRVLAGTTPGDRFYDRGLERQRGAPKAIRVRIHLLEPAPYAEHQACGVWWKRTLAGPHFPPQTLADMDVEHPLPPPELWHFEDIVWLERSRLGRAMAKVARGENPHLLITDAAPELAEFVEPFWNELVPWIAARHRDSFRGLRQSVNELRERYGRARLYAFERIAGRYGAFLAAKLEPVLNQPGLSGVFGTVEQPLGVGSYYELRLLTHHILTEGRAAYDRAIAEPRTARENAARMTMFTGHAFAALFRYEALVYQAHKQRLLDVVQKKRGQRELTEKQKLARDKNLAIGQRAFGALVVAEFLKTQFTGEEDVLDVPERWPVFEYTSEAEVVRADGLLAARHTPE